jgi:hypothetical protein
MLAEFPRLEQICDLWCNRHGNRKMFQGGTGRAHLFEAFAGGQASSGLRKVMILFPWRYFLQAFTWPDRVASMGGRERAQIVPGDPLIPRRRGNGETPENDLHAEAP